jgi:Bacterial regulatory proteins, luxR family
VLAQILVGRLRGPPGRAGRPALRLRGPDEDGRLPRPVLGGQNGRQGLERIDDYGPLPGGFGCPTLPRSNSSARLNCCCSRWPRAIKPQIAQRLFISHKTAAHHVSNILVKLALKTGAELVAYAIRTQAHVEAAPDATNAAQG